jgi:hypothetical protein
MPTPEPWFVACVIKDPDSDMLLVLVKSMSSTAAEDGAYGLL